MKKKTEISKENLIQKLKEQKEKLHSVQVEKQKTLDNREIKGFNKLDIEEKKLKESIENLTGDIWDLIRKEEKKEYEGKNKDATQKEKKNFWDSIFEEHLTRIKNKLKDNKIAIPQGDEELFVIEGNQLATPETDGELFLIDLSKEIYKKYIRLTEDNNFEGNPDELNDKAIDEVLKEKFSSDFEAKAFKPTEKELTIMKEVDAIIIEINKMGIHTQGVKPYLQEKLKEYIWERYKDPKKQTALGLSLKAFAKKYFWEYGIKRTQRYKDFDSFYKNIFLK